MIKRYNILQIILFCTFVSLIFNFSFAKNLKITGLSNDFFKDKKTFKENVNSFLEFISNDRLIIHNAPFDLGFINNELSLVGLPPLKNEITDTVLLARQTLNTRIANQDSAS